MPPFITIHHTQNGRNTPSGIFLPSFFRLFQIRSLLDILSFNAGITAQATYSCSPCISQIHSLYSFMPDFHHPRLSVLCSYRYSFCSSIFSLRSFYHCGKHMSRNLELFSPSITVQITVLSAWHLLASLCQEVMLAKVQLSIQYKCIMFVWNALILHAMSGTPV